MSILHLPRTYVEQMYNICITKNKIKLLYLCSNYCIYMLYRRYYTRNIYIIYPQ